MKRLMKRLVAFVLLLIIVLTPTVSFAHDAYFLQSLIDENQFLYQISVVNDKASRFNSESKHIEAELGDFSDLIGNYGAFSVSPDGYEESSSSGKDNMVFTFPSVEDGGWFSSKAKNNATSADANRAYMIRDYLSAGLNDALVLVNGGKFKNTKELMDMAQELSGGGTITNSKGETFDVEYGKTASYHKYPIDPDTNETVSVDPKTWINHDTDYVLITDEEGNEYEFVYRMVKGYHSDEYLRDGRSAYDGDAEYITWQHLIYQGNYNYVAKGFTSKDAGELNKPGAVEEMFVEFFENIFNGLRNLLGLYSAKELVYNDGIRGSRAYLYGIMPQTWADNTMIFHWLFQAIAWSLIGLAVVKALIKRNISTINSAVRASLIESIQDLLLTGFILAFIFPVMEMFMYLNIKLVNVLGAVAPDLSDMSGINNYSGAISGIILQGFYFIISLYLNFVYIMRALTIAILIASSPLFVVSIAFGGKWKNLFSTWLRELICNIFLQSFHAFVLAFFVQIQTSTRGIEGAVVAYALIPLTEFFKGLIMGPGGGFATGAGSAALSAGLGAVSGAVSGAFAGGRSKSKSTSDSESSTSNTNSRETTTYDTTKASGNSNKIDTTRREAQLDTKIAHENREIPLDKIDNDLGTSTFNIKSGDVGDVKLKDDSYEENLANIKNMEKADKLVEGKFEKTVGGAMGGIRQFGTEAGKTALSLSKAGAKAVAGTSVLLGAGSTPGGVILSNRTFASAGKDFKSATGSAKESIKGLAGAGVGVAKDVYSNISDNNHKKAVAEYYKKKDEDTNWKPLESEIYSRQLENGDREVHRDATILEHEGLVGASTQGQYTSLSYDLKNLDEGDRQNIQNYAMLYREATTNTSHLSGDELKKAEKTKADKMNFLRSQGVERIGMKQNGNVVVTYNDIGMKKLGMKSAYSTGDGRIVETKRIDDPIQTRRTFVIDNYVPKTPKNENFKNKNQSNAKGNQHNKKANTKTK